MKQLWKPSTILNPVPVVMVTCSDSCGKSNIITLAWAGTINSEPPMVSISVRKERYSHRLIKEKGQFVVNLTTSALAFATDLCGVKSGRDIDKFAAAGLTPVKASVVDVPLIRESPVNIECVVRNRLELGSHDMFTGEIVAVHVEDSLIDGKGKLCLDRAGLICYSHGEYWTLGEPIGYFGFSVTKKKRKLENGIKSRSRDNTYKK
jgi:flavin reductase (DIM6/NTAB) family NADH-FMN oxidoreductase RutF